MRHLKYILVVEMVVSDVDLIADEDMAQGIAEAAWEGLRRCDPVYKGVAQVVCVTPYVSAQV